MQPRSVINRGEITKQTNPPLITALSPNCTQVQISAHPEFRHPELKFPLSTFAFLWGWDWVGSGRVWSDPHRPTGSQRTAFFGQHSWYQCLGPGQGIRVVRGTQSQLPAVVSGGAMKHSPKLLKVNGLWCAWAYICIFLARNWLIDCTGEIFCTTPKKKFEIFL